MIQSRTYNNGTVLEYFYKISPKNGKQYTNSVFIEISSGKQVDPKKVKLVMDFASENKFLGVCCSIDCLDSFITNDGTCWACVDGFTWGV